MSRVRKVAFWLGLAVGLWVALTPNLGPQLPPGPWDKIEHFAGFYGLTLLAMLAYPGARRVWVLASLTAYGGLMEALQAIPALNRKAEWADLLADVLGIGAALLPTLLRRTR